MDKKKIEDKPTLQDRKRFDFIAKRFEGYKPASQVLTEVRAVPTWFIQYDHATRVGGYPIERFTLTHGESGEGKTEACIGLEGSFLERDHFVFHVDAERTTPISWPRMLMGKARDGSDLCDHPMYFASRPDTYEQTIADVRNFLNLVAESKKRGDVPPDTSALIVVDSLRKLVPKEMMKEILEAEADGADIKGGRDRSAQLKAKMNAAWMDEVVPLLEYAGAGFNAIAREMKDPDADQWARKFGTDYKVGGGSAIYYDASMVMRISRSSWITHGEGPDRKVYGERRKIEIRKTKVAGKEGKVAVAYFHSSNGVLIPAGFDRARDVLDLGEKFGVVEKKGASYSFEGERIGMGEHNAVKALTENREWLAEVEAAVRARFEQVEPSEWDEATGEVT